ncbi:metallopeptidase family protein [Amycolatopsis cihanbeyliensis]|uniref:Putative Zn-dependent protease with MMP-like domain n=1 Tax=Amycolatopsis cihanbeyliensis TaxID=1128664 RepID=A0A542DM14_AMYCI|nr:metallopeptidase family protein [Amycolatopsis cihanbeyliensis]TQJ04131.1 putative Zn-dependent protease with MMP-like domain [Amycolatopsis cihanbeyliensis]
MPVEMTLLRFEELVADALDRVPAEFAEAMDNVVVLVEERNEEEPDILGLYHGVALTERMSDYGGVLPDQIFIYRRPILAICETEEDVVSEVVITVVHEIAHHFGIDDARLHELGWG